jgi:carboxypeptidase C (cathepsin A)
VNGYVHLRIPDADTARVEWAHDESGHMMYVQEPSRLRQSADLAGFVQRASA